MNKFVKGLLVIGGTLLLVLVLWQLRFVLFILLFSLFIAAAVRPLTRYLNQWHIKPVISQIAIYFVIFTVLVVSLYLVSDLLPREVSQLFSDFERGYAILHTEMSNGSPALQSVAQWLPNSADVMMFLQDGETNMLELVLGVGQRAFAILGGIGVAIVLSIYWSFDQVYFERLWLSAMPAERRSYIRDTWRDIEREIGFYIQSQVIQFVGTFVTLGSVFWIIGMPYVVTLSIVAATVALIPFVGVLITVMVGFLVGLKVGVVFASLAAVGVLFISVFMRYVITTGIFDYRSYSSLLVVLTLIPFYETFGLFGFVLAPPFTVTVQLFLSHIFKASMRKGQYQNSETVDTLKARMDNLSLAIQQEQTETAPENVQELASLIGRLGGLLTQANQLAVEKKE